MRPRLLLLVNFSFPAASFSSATFAIALRNTGFLLWRSWLDRIALDTNVLAYAEGINGDDRRHQAAGVIAGLQTGATSMLDQAGWHISNKLKIHYNITLLTLRKNRRQLNLTENIYQYMLENWLYNRFSRSDNDISDHLHHARKTITNRLWLTMSIGMRDLAYGS